ncbi:L-seryl-tRNA(Sec) selenium transferase [Shewanella eurypsychrophilus]|uniref:L-seryl-tRNA(Sec) selenium transferase n=1 Tax=Shewanella eurypsychrophilus TaxID=2593656 RepID=A0ABX6VD50_9GAMM|nr:MULTISPECIES: L-seryl-tRNA(Sec) selenium transferase [Shewanella]QFU24527.1 L-seryl-tRNA(Sec) selenium transferase [Shewanella sp. YLB-09]QPG59725.1 L-seryl-tRNA(Sec) selenium transferase [Shewanella eurypsychrophilus]
MTQAINTTTALYRSLPAMDSLLVNKAVIKLRQEYGDAWVKNQLNKLLNQARSQIAERQILPKYCATANTIITALTQRLLEEQRHSLQPVWNLTGTILHTNLGRSQLSESAISAVTKVMRHPTPLEFELEAGKRGHRDQAIGKILNQLTGSQSCCLVNNNAAAVLLMLSSVAAGKEVIVSRGELVEIGGAFRIPDIMRQAGCTLVEVGSTNRTHLKDYQEAITENTAAIMKVHTSNYHIQGFTSAVDEKALAQLCQQHQLPLISDLGSGALTDLTEFGLGDEPTPQQMLADGVNLISFSGDKLLGGPQAGLIVGDEALIEKLQQHPLKRALRCDKMTLAALEATLLLYRNPLKLNNELPMLKKMSRPLYELEQLGQLLMAELPEFFSPHFNLAITPSKTQIGSGSQPNTLLDSLALTFTPTAKSRYAVHQLEQKFKRSQRPIIGRINHNQYWLDLRGAEQEVRLINALREVGQKL